MRVQVHPVGFRIKHDSRIVDVRVIAECKENGMVRHREDHIVSAARTESKRCLIGWVALGTTHEKIARQYTENIKTYDSDVTALRALEQGKHDVVITDNIVGELAISQSGLNIRKSGAALTEEQHGIAVRKGNTELLNKINEALKAMHEDGTYEKLSEKYFKRDISKKE